MLPQITGPAFQVYRALWIALFVFGAGFQVVVAVQDAAAWLREDVRHARDGDPELYGPEIHMLHNEKYVRIALRLGLWELWHAPDFEQAMIDIVNRGGDSDTNAAIAGAMLGAYWGESAIPQHWGDLVMNALRPTV